MRAGHLAWAMTAITAGLAVATTVFGYLNGDTPLPALESVNDVSLLNQLTFSVMFAAFAGLGGLLAARRPRNAIGWLLCVAPLSLGVSGVVTGWYVHAFYSDPGSQGPPEGLMWVGNWIWVVGFPPLLTALLLRFPDGRLPSRRWWPAGALTGVALTALGLGTAFKPGPLDDFPQVENPLGADGGLGEAVERLQQIGFPLLLLAVLVSAAALVARFEHSGGVERQQLKWMAAATTVAVVAYVVNIALDELFGITGGFLFPIILLALPAAATVAILRYRLYDLGLVVNRTLVYGGLTIALGATYLGLVLLAGLAVGRSSDFAIAASTLAVATLFRPLRARIQALVDRRFYRRRYDAARTLEAFGGRLRDEVDLRALGADLEGAVRNTVQPTHVSLWLRGAS